MSSLRACDCLICMVAFSPPGLLLIHIRLRFGCYIMMSQFLVFFLSLWKSSFFSRKLYYGYLVISFFFSDKKEGGGNLLVSNVLFEYVTCFIRNSVIFRNFFWIYPILLSPGSAILLRCRFTSLSLVYKNIMISDYTLWEIMTLRRMIIQSIVIIFVRVRSKIFRNLVGKIQTLVY